MGQYENLRRSAIVYLGDLFSELDYPFDVQEKFNFVWRFVTLDVPNGTSGILSPEVYEREKEKFVRTMEEARELAVLSLREEFGSMVQHICERFCQGPDGKPKVFKNSTVEGFYDYFQTFKERNIFQDEELSGLVSRAQAILAGNDADTIRSSEFLKRRIKEGMQEVESTMEDLVTRPRRKIVMN